MRTVTFILLALAATVAALCISERASRAYQTGDSRWCHVTNIGGDADHWDCEDYDSIDDCQPAIVTGGGYCAINPSWHPDPSQSESAPVTETTPALAVVPIPKPKPH